MNITKIIEEIVNTGSRGKDLLMEAFIIGLAWGRGELKNLQNLQKAIQQLISLNHQINSSQVCSFQKLDQFNEYLNNNLQLFKIPKLFAFISPHQLSSPQKPLQSNQQTLQNTINKQQQQFNISCDDQSSKLCQICHFIIEISQNQQSKLSDCQHQFHSLCLYIHSQQNGNFCPVCKNQLAKDYIKVLLENLPEQYKSCCPNQKCFDSFLYYGQDLFECNSCLTQWCLKCKRQQHQNNNCILEFDHFHMQMGFKYKFCSNSQKFLFLNKLPSQNNLKKC
ncbi:unnamed protein product [Paramecium sonneborni]|uniref:RING-type domain-containing protein n=1 Tax=Paramecium sonneborni TaxID=65129 RepID=A0A8S1PNV4_9CILI|nr:unnamed protein product [Paramecium sonneborni]